ncbi:MULTISPECIES: DUF2804 domain-containing protein [unclassified Moraxella]|uniref:DUF2804 domain-containing protein n=1 Tax=unclassified Moraxella TaxID=2685852 RepID=UPI003AF4ED30
MKTNPISLPTLDQLLINGKPQFGVFRRVNHVNYLDYPSHRLSQKPLKQWQKWLATNQFCFIRISQPPYQICVAIATIKLATTCFCYIYDENTQSIVIDEQLAPFTLNTKLNQSPYTGKMAFVNKKSQVSIEFFEHHFDISIHNKLVQLQATAQRYAEPLAVCSPAGRHGWVFTQKEVANQLTGQWQINNNASLSRDFSTNALLSLDWTIGYMRRVTTWFWVSIHGFLHDGRQFSLNLATGVNESGTSENACWIDGKIAYLPAVIFERERQASMQPSMQSAMQAWRIYHQNLGWSDVDINLTFTPIHCYQKNDRFVVIDSIFEQWVGHYRGEIRLGEEVIQIDNLLGLAEDHYAKW